MKIHCMTMKTKSSAAAAPLLALGDSDCVVETLYDVCIVGAGIAGLTMLSAIREPYSIDTLSDHQVTRALHSMSKSAKRNGSGDLKVCVVDVHQTWFHTWKKNFGMLDIEYLRSPTMAHPNMFDKNALLAYAVANDRIDELLESGCFDCTTLLPLGQTQVGLWKLPSSKLFIDFCEDLVKTLQHDYIQGKITNLTRIKKEDGNDGVRTAFQLEIDNGRLLLSSKAVILATGPIGRPSIPLCLKPLIGWNEEVKKRVFMWNELDEVNYDPSVPNRTYMVVGGGLTAVQVALKLLNQQRRGSNNDITVYLCSRRPLMEKHFDIGLEWFDQRTTNKCMCDFYHQSISHRLQMLKEARDGGSVPPIYMRQLEQYETEEAASKLTRIIGILDHATYIDDGKQLRVTINQNNKCTSSVTTLDVDQVVVACGIQPDCTSNPLIRSILDQWPIPTYGGLPCITEDCKWKNEDEDVTDDGDDDNKDFPLYVVGSLGALNIGPDAGNIMGIRRASQLVANDLGCRAWLRQESSNVMVNPYNALLMSDSEDDSDDESIADNDGMKEKYSNTFNGDDDDTASTVTKNSNCSTCNGDKLHPEEEAGGGVEVDEAVKGMVVDVAVTEEIKETTITRIPDECRNRVFQFLSIDDFGTIPCVCSQFQQDTLDDKMLYFPKDRIVTVDCKNVNYPQRLLQKLINMNINRADKFQRFTHLKLLNFDNVLTYSTSSSNGFAVSEWPFEYQLLMLKDLIQDMTIPYVTSFDMSCCYNKKGTSLPPLPLVVPSMLYKSMVKLFPNLRTLKLNSISSIGPLENKFATLLPYLDTSLSQTLEHLEWTNHGYGHEQIMASTSCWEQQVEYFNSNFFKTTTMHLDGRYLAYCRNLHTLHMDHSIFWFRRSEEDPTEALGLLKHVRNLQYVSLRGCQYVNLSFPTTTASTGGGGTTDKVEDGGHSAILQPLTQYMLMNFVKRNSNCLKWFRSDLSIGNKLILNKSYPTIKLN